MYTHRLFLKDGHTFMTDADRALMEQCKVDAQQSAAAAVEAAAKAQEHAATIDTDRIDASIALKADNLYYDPESRMLYLSSNGTKIGEGIPISANINSATLIVENTTGWSTKTIPNNQDSCIISINWSSVDGGVSTGSGSVTIKVENELQYSADIKQGVFTSDILKYLHLGENRIDLTVTDFRGNSKSTLFVVSMYDPNALISTKLVERTLTGDYTNDRVTKVGNGAFIGLTLRRLSLPNVTAVEEKGLGATATEIELQSLPELYYRAFMGGDIDVVKVPSVVRLTHYQALFLDKKINRMIFNCVNLETSGNPLESTWNKVVTFDFHRLKSLPVIPGGSTRTVIIRTPEVCALQTAPGTTAVNVYVPASLVDSYKLETNWSAMADQIFAIEDHPDICEVSVNA